MEQDPQPQIDYIFGLTDWEDILFFINQRQGKKGVWRRNNYQSDVTEAEVKEFCRDRLLYVWKSAALVKRGYTSARRGFLFTCYYDKVFTNVRMLRLAYTVTRISSDRFIDAEGMGQLNASLSQSQEPSKDPDYRNIVLEL